MLAFSIDYYGIFFRATQSVELFCTYLTKFLRLLKKYNKIRIKKMKTNYKMMVTGEEKNE